MHLRILTTEAGEGRPPRSWRRNRNAESSPVRAIRGCTGRHRVRPAVERPRPIRRGHPGRRHAGGPDRHLDAAAQDARSAHHPRRQAGLPAVLHRRRPEQRQGLRVGAGLRRRRAARLHQGSDHLGLHVVQRLVRAGPEGIRLLHHAGQHHRGAEAGGRLQRPVLPVAIGRRDQADSPVLEATTLAELAKFRFGAQVGTTYYTAITDDIKPDDRRRSSSTPRPIRLRRWSTTRSMPSSRIWRAPPTSRPSSSRAS